MAEKILVYYFLCTSRGSLPAQSSRTAIRLDQRVPDLEHAIEHAEDRRGQIRLWKVKSSRIHRYRLSKLI
jgi:hypothetical protein